MDDRVLFHDFVVKAMPNWNCVKRQLKFYKPRYLFTKTHKPKMKTQTFYDKKQWIICIFNEETSS